MGYVAMTMPVQGGLSSMDWDYMKLDQLLNFLLICSYLEMKLGIVHAMIVVAFSSTSSQPTYDFMNQVSECGCQQEIEMLQRQIILLQNKVDSMLDNEQTTKDVSLTTTPMHLIVNISSKTTQA